MIVYLLNILLVDDDIDTLRLVQKYFEKKGAHVNAYSNTLLALEDFKKNKNHSYSHYDLIISDIRMPKMNGIELAFIRKMDQNIPIIFMTASNISDIDKSLKILNIEDVVTKPIKLKDLVEKINTVKQKIVVKHPY